MLTTSLGACDQFVRNLRRSNLIENAKLDQVVGNYLRVHLRAEPAALANHLVSEELLTRFQADRLLKGDTQDLVLGPYVLMELAGFGNMGPVFKVLSKTDNRWYALKVLPRRSMWNVLLAKRQVRAFEKIQHPSVVPFADVGTAGSQHYLVWPFVEGESLEKIVQREGKLASGLVAHYGYQIAEALSVCQQQGQFHGLLKPSNVLVDGDQHVRVVDFGVGAILAATDHDQSLFNTQGQADLLTGGLDCASPESITDPSNLAPEGDQYSLGCVLYFCLADRFPFEGQPVEKMVAHQSKQPTPLSELNPDIRKELVAVVERLMQKSPQARYADAGEAAKALKPLAFVPMKRSAPLAPMAPDRAIYQTRPAVQAPSLPARPTARQSQDVTPSPAASLSVPGPVIAPEVPTEAPKTGDSITSRIRSLVKRIRHSRRFRWFAFLSLGLLVGLITWIIWHKLQGK
jgi:serine/threonine-protein kinase